MPQDNKPHLGQTFQTETLPTFEIGGDDAVEGFEVLRRKVVLSDDRFSLGRFGPLPVRQSHVWIRGVSPLMDNFRSRCVAQIRNCVPRCDFTR